MNASIALIDGPCGGRTILYGWPLPHTLVIGDRTQNGIRYHDYTQTMVGLRYRHSDRCKCNAYGVAPVELDSARAQ